MVVNSNTASISAWWPHRSIRRRLKMYCNFILFCTFVYIVFPIVFFYCIYAKYDIIIYTLFLFFFVFFFCICKRKEKRSWMNGAFRRQPKYFWMKFLVNVYFPNKSCCTNIRIFNQNMHGLSLISRWKGISLIDAASRNFYYAIFRSN